MALCRASAPCARSLWAAAAPAAPRSAAWRQGAAPGRQRCPGAGSSAVPAGFAFAAAAVASLRSVRRHSLSTHLGSTRLYASERSAAASGMEAITVSARGKSFPAFVCGSLGSPGVVVLQEWWGVTEQIQLQAQRIAEQGYRCLVPDLYKGKIGVDAEEASHLMGNLNFPEAVAEIKAATDFLSMEGSKKCGVTGFCMGGALSLATAVQAEGDVVCAAPFYGIPDKAYFDWSTIKIPVQAHFGKLDALQGFSDPPTAGLLKEALEAAGCEYEVFMYDGVAHGFMNDTPEMIERKKAMFGAEHSPEAVEAAYGRLFGFLAKHLKS